MTFTLLPSVLDLVFKAESFELFQRSQSSDSTSMTFTATNRGRTHGSHPIFRSNQRGHFHSHDNNSYNWGCTTYIRVIDHLTAKYAAWRVIMLITVTNGTLGLTKLMLTLLKLSTRPVLLLDSSLLTCVQTLGLSSIWPLIHLFWISLKITRINVLWL